MEKISSKEAYEKLMELFRNNASNQKISELAVDLRVALDSASPQIVDDTLYDLSLLDMPGMELDKNDVLALINKLI